MRLAGRLLTARPLARSDNTAACPPCLCVCVPSHPPPPAPSVYNHVYPPPSTKCSCWLVELPAVSYPLGLWTGVVGRTPHSRSTPPNTAAATAAAAHQSDAESPQVDEGQDGQPQDELLRLGGRDIALPQRLSMSPHPGGCGGPYCCGCWEGCWSAVAAFAGTQHLFCSWLG